MVRTSLPAAGWGGSPVPSGQQQAGGSGGGWGTPGLAHWQERGVCSACPHSWGKGPGLLCPGERLQMLRPMAVPVDKPQNQPRPKKSIISFRLRINNTNNM